MLFSLIYFRHIEQEKFIPIFSCINYYLHSPKRQSYLALVIQWTKYNPSWQDNCTPNLLRNYFQCCEAFWLLFQGQQLYIEFPVKFSSWGKQVCIRKAFMLTLLIFLFPTWLIYLNLFDFSYLFWFNWLKIAELSIYLLSSKWHPRLCLTKWASEKLEWPK